MNELFEQLVLPCYCVLGVNLGYQYLCTSCKVIAALIIIILDMHAAITVIIVLAEVTRKKSSRYNIRYNIMGPPTEYHHLFLCKKYPITDRMRV